MGTLDPKSPDCQVMSFSFRQIDLFCIPVPRVLHIGFALSVFAQNYSFLLGGGEVRTELLK